MHHGKKFVVRQKPQKFPSRLFCRIRYANVHMYTVIHVQICNNIIFLCIYIALIPLTLFPHYGNVLGGTTVQVFGPCFDEFVNHTITCSFNEIEVQAIFIDSNSVICISPGLTSLGRINFALTIEDIDAEFQETTFYSCKCVATTHT